MPGFARGSLFGRFGIEHFVYFTLLFSPIRFWSYARGSAQTARASTSRVDVFLWPLFALSWMRRKSARQLDECIVSILEYVLHTISLTK